MNKRELVTVFAALRLWQDCLEGQKTGLAAVMGDFGVYRAIARIGGATPLSIEEIDDLVERLTDEA
jgi:hypothetical protein